MSLDDVVDNIAESTQSFQHQHLPRAYSTAIECNKTLQSLSAAASICVTSQVRTNFVCRARFGFASSVRESSRIHYSGSCRRWGAKELADNRCVLQTLHPGDYHVTVRSAETLISLEINPPNPADETLIQPQICSLIKILWKTIARLHAGHFVCGKARSSAIIAKIYISVTTASLLQLDRHQVHIMF